MYEVDGTKVGDPKGYVHQEWCSPWNQLRHGMAVAVTQGNGVFTVYWET
jgi:hypothetical protein